MLTEFGAVEYDSRKTFHGALLEATPDPDDPAQSRRTGVELQDKAIVMAEFAEWLKQFKGRPIFVSDNPAYDWQWINYYFHHYYGDNPFGHSGRRISDFYAGLVGNFYKTQEWKRFRVTPHDHNPVNDAMGNVEAFESLLNGKR